LTQCLCELPKDGEGRTESVAVSSLNCHKFSVPSNSPLLALDPKLLSQRPRELPKDGEGRTGLVAMLSSLKPLHSIENSHSRSCNPKQREGFEYIKDWINKTAEEGNAEDQNVSPPHSTLGDGSEDGSNSDKTNINGKGGGEGGGDSPDGHGGANELSNDSGSSFSSDGSSTSSRSRSSTPNSIESQFSDEEDREGNDAARILSRARSLPEVIDSQLTQGWPTWRDLLSVQAGLRKAYTE
jgi:hypothetical protein